MTSELGKDPFVSLRSGEALGPDDLKLVSARDDTTVILLAGPVGCGKTTVLAALYESFNEGPVAGFLFGGSETLTGFERICHPGRVQSGLATAETWRTNPHSGAAFLHLRAADVSLGYPRVSSVLISDVTGEAFDEARDVSAPTTLPKSLWRRANIICIFLDGAKLSRPTSRQVVRVGARNLLRSATESGFVAPDCRLALVTTKWDLVRSPDTEVFVGQTEELLEAQYSPHFRSIARHRIAARPDSESVPYAFGIPDLLTDWLKPRPSRPKIARPSESGGGGLGHFARSTWAKDQNWLEALDVV